jgi:nucleotide-binding universal stress UspA family protein
MSRTDDTHAPGGRIVVGVDGSEPSARALRWALRQAELTGGVVEAVAAWEYPQYYTWGGMPSLGPDEVGTFEEAARRALEETVRKTAGPEPGARIRTRVAHGQAARALLDAAEGAALLVLGSRGHGGFAGALLGSVGQHCIQHAHCPVVVIRGEPSAEERP